MFYDDYSEWEEKYSQVDGIVSDFIVERNWQDYVPDCDTEMFAKFCRHLMYVLARFLEEPETRELFVRIPVNEFCNKDEHTGDSLQIQRWQSVINAVISCLSLAVIEKTKANAIPTRQEYRDRDNFIYFNNNNRPRTCRYNSTNGRMEGDQNADTAFYRSYSTMRVRRDFVVNSRNSERALTDVLETKNQIQGQSSKKMPVQYSSAILITLGAISPSTTKVVWKSDMIDVPLRLTSNPEDVSRCQPDIVVAFGDDKYRGSFNRYRNTSAKKIIYVGSDAPYDGVQTYYFTYHEIYRYCRMGDAPFFYEPESNFVSLSFPWLKERKDELTQILNDCSQSDAALTADVQTTCLNRLLRPFANARFDSEKLEELKDRVYGDVDDIFPYDVDLSTIDEVLEWYRQLSYEGTNPKQLYFDEHNNELSIAKFDSYKNRIKDLRGYENTVNVDNLAYHMYDDRYDYIMRNLLFAKVVPIYYEGFEDRSKETLKGFYSNELRALSGRIYGTRIIIPDDHYENNVDYNNFFEEEYKQVSTIYEPGDIISYRVVFNDNTDALVDGDVLVDFGSGLERIKISDLYEKSNYQFPCVYYRGADNMDTLMQVGLDIPEEVMGKVDDYASLWKEKYRKVFDRYRQEACSIREAVDFIYDKCRISKNSLRKYSTADVTHRFLVKSDMLTMCDFLINEQEIESLDKNRILKARELVENKKSFGRTLKDIVMSLYLGEDIIDTMKKRILENLNKGGYSKERLTEMTLTEGKTIRTIRKF